MHGSVRRPGSKDHFVIPFNGFSMYPFLRPGDLLVVKTPPSHAFKPGDIILFKSGRPGQFEGLIAHRVIRVRSNGEILTKGDNLRRPDPELEDRSQILGQIVSVLRGDRAIPLDRGLLRFAAKWIALLSRKNATPGILATEIKNLAGRIR